MRVAASLTLTVFFCFLTPAYMYYPDDTIVAIATALGVAGLGSCDSVGLRLSGLPRGSWRELLNYNLDTQR